MEGLMSCFCLPSSVLVAPEDLRVDVVASYWISISWTQSPMNRDISGHIILLSGGGRTWNVTGDSSETSIRVTGLQPDTEYQMRVVAVATDGRTSPPSDQITATTLTGAALIILNTTYVSMHASVCMQTRANFRPVVLTWEGLEY